MPSSEAQLLCEDLNIAHEMLARANVTVLK